MIRMIFSTVRAPHEPAFTVESLAMTQTGRPATVAVPVMTPSAGRSPASTFAYKPSSTREPSSTSRATRSRANSLPLAALASWYLRAPPCSTVVRRSARWACPGSCSRSEGVVTTRKPASRVAVCRKGVGPPCLAGEVTMPTPTPAPTPAPVRATWWSVRVGGLPRAFWVLWSASLINRLGQFVYPFLALFLTHSRGYSVAKSGLVLTALGLGAFLSQPLGGSLADRIGRRRTIVGGMFASAAAMIALGAAHGLPMLCITAFLVGVATDLYRPASSAAVTDLVGPDLRPRAFALLFWSFNLGFAVASTLGGYLADRGYWLLFIGDAATSVTFAMVVLRFVPETKPTHQTSEGSFAEVLRDRLLQALVLGTVLQAMAYMQAYSTLPIVIADDG